MRKPACRRLDAGRQKEKEAKMKKTCKKWKRVWAKGWKVVYSEWGTYFSPCVDMDKAGCAEYQVGKVTRPTPGCGPLSVFTQYESARAFKWELRSPHCHIFECEYLTSNENGIWMDRKKDFIPLGWLPSGTALAEAVRLIREVPE